MGRRILVLLLSVIVVALPPAVSALGLGEITLKSALNQPLHAEIQLLQVRDLTKSEILVGLASADDFERVGVDRPYFLTNLRFAVVLDAPGGPVIRLSSNKPVREPFVNFVLQAQWPSGKLLREYTLLMDLPVFSDQKARPVTAAQSQPQQPQPTQQQIAAQPQVTTPKKSQGYNPRTSFDEAPTRPTVTQQTRPRQSSQTQAQRPAQPAYDESAYGPVQANETLWQIAQQIRPDRSVSIQQTMLAIQRLNPEAFINNNINLLRKGQILRVPDRTQIIEYSKREAIQEVAVQNNQWSGNANAGYESTSGAQLEGSRSVTSSDEQTQAVEGRVKLTSPEDVTGSEAGRGAGAGASSLDAIENELAITLEQLDKSERENSDLKSRVESLEEQISTQERMLEIRSEELRAMELAAEKNREQEALAEANLEQIEDTTGIDEPDAFGTEDSLADTGMDSLDQDIIIDDEVDDEVDDEMGLGEAVVAESTPEPTLAPTPETVDTKKVISAPTPAKKSIIEHLLDNLVFIAGGLAALVLAAYFFLRYRNTSEEIETEDDFLSQPFDDFKEEEALVEPPEEELNLDAEPEEEEQEYEAEPEVDEEPVAGAQTEDVVAEADIYIAYGKYDQAEEMLLTALENEPKNVDVRVKLLEVYATQSDVERFDPQFARLLATEDAIAKQRGHQLREGIAGAPPFDGSLYDISDETSTIDMDNSASVLSELDDLDVEADNDFDELTLDLGDSDDLPLESSDDGEALDFELDLDEQAIAANKNEDDDSLDFELDLDAEEFDTELEPAESPDTALDLDLELPEEESAAEPLDLELDIEDTADGEEIDVEDFDLDFDLEADEDVPAKESDKTGVFDTSDLADLTIDEDLPDTEPEEFDLSDLENLPGEDEELAFESTSDKPLTTYSLEPEVDSDSEFDLETELESLDDASDTLDDEITDTANANDDNLDLDDSLDLSELDKELDALTSGLSIEGADIDNLESVLDEDVPSEDEDNLDLEDGLETPTVMVEPVTDFDDFDDELQADLREDDIEALEDDTPEHVAESGEDRLFDQAVADVPESDLEFELPDIDPEADDDDLGFLSDSDETATKLDLARAYIDMGDAEGAKDILGEIIKEGNVQQKQEAESLLARV